MDAMEKYKEEANGHLEQLIDIVASMTDEANGDGWSVEVWGDLKDALTQLGNIEDTLDSIPDKPDAVNGEKVAS